MTAHSHGHLPAKPVRRVQRLLLLLVLPFVVLSGVGLVALWPADMSPEPPDAVGPPARLSRASVFEVRRGPCQNTTEDQKVICQKTRLDVSGRKELVRLEISLGVGYPTLHRGDKILVGSAGGEFYFHDFQRRRPMLLLGVLFAAAVIGLGRWRGAMALVGLAISLLVLVRFVLPGILEGQSPVLVSLVGASLVMFAALYLAHGFNARTTTAVIGTMSSLVLTGVLAAIFISATKLTGLAGEEAGTLQALAGQIDLQGLLLGGVIIGSLGVLDDVTVTQAAAVWELRAANPAAGFGELYRAGVRIGRDHIASTVNTLVLAYAGASLPLLVLFTLSNQNLMNILTGELVAPEVVRTLVGSIGLVASVPITTALAAFVVTQDEEPVSGAAGLA